MLFTSCKDTIFLNTKYKFEIFFYHGNPKNHRQVAHRALTLCYRKLLKTLFVMLNLIQHPLVKCLVCNGLRVKPAMTGIREIAFLEVPYNNRQKKGCESSLFKFYLVFYYFFDYLILVFISYRHIINAAA